MPLWFKFDYHLVFIVPGLWLEEFMQDINPIVAEIGNLMGRVRALRGYL